VPQSSQRLQQVLVNPSFFYLLVEKDKNASITVLRLLKKVLTINYSMSVQGQESKVDTLIEKLIYDLQLERFPLAIEYVNKR
jgi:hypothetical protein